MLDKRTWIILSSLAGAVLGSAFLGAAVLGGPTADTIGVCCLGDSIGYAVTWEECMTQGGIFLPGDFEPPEEGDPTPCDALPGHD